jgi:hypothetical protein
MRHALRLATPLLAFVLLSLLPARPAQAEEETHGRYGSLWLGPRLGPGVGIRGPRGAYAVGLQLGYRTPYFFYYNLEVGFLHQLPRTITVPASFETAVDGTEVTIVPEHDVTVTGLYGIPMTLEIGLRLDLHRVTLRAGVAFGAMVSIETIESEGTDDSETIASFCFRPDIGVDVAVAGGAGLVMIDVMYLWQDAAFEQTGDDHTVDTVLLTVGYAFRLLD